MYSVRAGHYLVDISYAEFEDVVDAMDFCDRLYNEGFDYAEVVDADKKIQYMVEDRQPRTQSEREGRRLRAEEFSLHWNLWGRLKSTLTPQQYQDAVFRTYAHNIQYSNDLDTIMGYFHGKPVRMPSAQEVLKAFSA
jgi:hypothetical protein